MMPASGRSLPGPASGKSGHVPYASEADGYSELGGPRQTTADVPYWTQVLAAAVER
jgi:hypothetical protein